MAGTVTVGCKLPHGLQLQLYDMVERRVAVGGGVTQTIKVAQKRGDAVTVRGNSIAAKTLAGYPIVGGYALTPNIDADFFDEWMKQNADHPSVKKGLIFAHEKTEFVEGRARDGAKLINGLEPIDAENHDARMRGRNGPAIQTADVRA